MGYGIVQVWKEFRFPREVARRQTRILEYIIKTGTGTTLRWRRTPYNEYRNNSRLLPNGIIVFTKRN